MKPIRIVIADDHSVVRLGLIALFKYQQGLKVVGEADDGESALERVAALKPDVLVLDLMMPGMDGATTAQLVRERAPETKILILTSFGTSADLARAVAAGASGAVLKGAANEELLAAIRTVAAGGQAFSAEIEGSLRDMPEPPSFTRRQLQILESVTRGLTNPDIARQLGISTDAVKQHLNAIYQKLDVSTRTEAITAALRRHLLKF
ncbi:MAG: response regulator [Kiritimatiellia bacterium]